MAGVKITDYVELDATPDDADLLEIVDDVAGTPTSKKNYDCKFKKYEWI